MNHSLPATVSAAASFAQQRLWFLDRFEPGSAVYNMPLAVRLGGTLNRAAIVAALEQIAARHETLRTSFAVEEGEVVQVIAAETAVALRDATVTDDDALREALATEARRPFDLTCGPLWRAVLWRRAPDDHVLQLTVHHVISDGWSLGVLVREFAACYRAHAADEPAALPELAIQYADFAAWQRDGLQGDTLAAGVAHWRARLADAPADLPLQTERPRPAVRSLAGRIHRFTLGPELTRALHELSRRGGGSLFMTLLGGFAVLLHRVSERADLVIGTPVANRTRRELEPLIGFFVNTLALRLDLAGSPTVRALLAQVRSVTLEALTHQDVPFEKLVQELQPGRTLANTPLFQVMFVLQNAPLGELRLPGLSATPLDVETGTAKFDLTLALEESAGGLIGRLEYNLEIFEAATVEHFARIYARVLEQFVAAPDAGIGELDLLDEDGAARVLGEWSGRARPYPERALGELFAAQAAARPAAVAVKFGAATLTYAELEARANRLAHALLAAGVQPDTPVPVCLERSLDLIVALLGVVKAGGAYVAIEPEQPIARVALLLAEARGPIVLTQEKFAEKLAAVRGAAALFCLDRDAAALAAHAPTAPAVAVGPDHLAYICYTSGSTGRPKGVCVPHRGIARLVLNTDFVDLGPDEIFLELAPVAFDASTLEIWAPLLNGGCLIVAPPGLPTLEEIGRLVRTEKITTLFLTSGLFPLVVDECLADFGGVKQLLIGGDVLSVPHVRTMLQAHPRLRLINGYGPTENTTLTTCHTVVARDLALASLPIGRAIANTQVYVLDARFRAVPVGVPGELCTGGAGLARGYLANPEFTAEKFIPNPFGPGRLYRTGDRVRWRADGTIEFLGRVDTQVKLRGFRIEPGEVEAALLAVPGVKTAAVVVHAHAGLKHLVGYVTGAVDGASVRARLQARLPDHLVPAVVMVLDALPRNANDKLDRAALPPPDFAAAVAADSFVPPRTPAEEILAHLWARVLRLDRVGVRDNFFAIGGHSLLATQLVTRMREAFGVELPLRAVFEAPTVAALASRLEAARRDEAAAPPLRAWPRTGELPLSFAQERLWFLNQLEPGNPFYNIPAALRLHGALDATAAARALRELGRRHESLRTVFASVEGRPVQRILAEFELPLPLVDLAALAAEERAAAIARHTADEARRPFDLATGPLWRARLLRLAVDEHILLLTMHHIVSDGWSMGVLTQEMGALYAAFAQGRPSPLPELAVHYADFAVWQRHYLSGPVLQRQLDYWQRQLAGAPPVLKLPTDRARPPVQSFRGGSHAFTLDRALAERLLALSRETGATLFMTLQAAFAAVLSRWCDQDDIVIGTPIANRHRAEIEPLIGFFVNTLVLRTDLSGSPGFRELLARVRRTALDAYAHQDLPFERLVDELQPERDLSRNPVFQVMFALQNAPQREQALPGLTITDLAAERISAQFDLVLDMWETSDGLKAVFEYATDLFDAATIRRLAGHFATLLAGAVAEPDAPVARLPLLTTAERAELLDGFNATAMSYPHDRTLQTLIAEQAVLGPERTAAVHGGAQLTYAELDARAGRLAHRLRALGVRRNDFVGILDERGLDFLVAMVGILKAGAAFLPIDPGYPEERVRFMIGDSRVATLITRASVLARFDLAGAGEALRELVLLDDPPAAFRDGGRRLHPRSSWANETTLASVEAGAPDDFAYMLYTSGSTGLPKGAIVRHNGAVNHIHGQFRELAFHRDSAFLQSAPSSSDISVWQFLAPLLIGGRTVIADYEIVCDAAKLHALIRARRITLIELVPVVLKELLDHAATLPAATRALPDLEFAMVTGEAVSVALVNQWFAVYPRLRLVNAYGPTEAADDVCQAVLDGPLPLDAATVPIGRTLPNLTLYVLDRHLQLVPIGVPGEIGVSGVGVGAGYWRNEEKTRAAFVPNPHADARRGDVIYRTGDLGRWRPDGSLEMLGRFDQQVKLRGFRIELGEIEGALGQHPAVAETVVLVREDRPGDRRLAAYVTPDEAGASWREKVTALQREQVALWQDLHEDSYRDTLTYDDPTFNVIGWDSNYTGQPLPEAEMREYVEHTIARVRELQPRRVLEIGCGTGLLFFPLAPHLEHYVGTDLSSVAIRQLAVLRDQRPALAHAELRAQRADDFTGLVPGSCDVVMLCSVVQYFPGIDYLLAVLDGALRLLRPGGAIFLGDVRLRPLLPAFHASVQLGKAPDTLDAAGLRRRVRGALAREQEMAVDPEFFAALRTRFPQITRVEIRPKAGRRHNEMTRFRGDVTLHIGATPPPAAAPMAWIDWPDRPLSLSDLRRELGARGDGALGVRRIANPRVHRELSTLAWLESARAGESVADFRAALAREEPAGLEPEALRDLGAELGWDVQTAFALATADGSFDAVFQRPAEGAPVSRWDFFASSPAPRAWRSYANDPLHEKLARELVPQLRGFLRERLPAYMVPADFTVLEAMPLLPNGKIDRQALPAPEADATGLADDFTAPRTPAEEKLAAIWAAVLGRESVSVTANFFELGGHSLKATQVVSRIQKELGVEVALREMFSHPTIAELAGEVETRRRGAYAAIPRVAEAADHPLSHAQLRLWVLAQMEGASVAYNMPAALWLEGALDAEALDRALAAVVLRHEALRTTFVVVNGEPRQRIHAAPLARLARKDLSDASDAEARARELALADATQPFDLERGPLLRTTLLRLAAARHVLLFNVHHIVSDDWSTGVLVRELMQAYAAFARGVEPELPALRLQYRDYAAWQNARLEADAMAPHRDFWRAQFAGELPGLDLPADFPRPPVKTYRGRVRAYAVPPELARELNALARREQASLFMVLVAAVQTLLHRHTGQRDLIVGFPIAGRNHPDLEDQIGFYINTLPLRTAVDPAATFAGLLAQVRATTTAAYEHQAYPFDRLVDDLKLARDVTRSPLFDVVVVMQNVDPYTLALDGVTVRPFAIDYDASKFDLQFNFEERDGALLGQIVFNSDLYADERIARLVAQVPVLLASIAADPAQAIGRLNLLPPEERRHVLAAANPAPVEYPRGRTLATWFEAQVARAPDAIAVTLGAMSLSYRELNARANRLAHRLRALGVGPDQLVGLYLERSLEMIVGLLGVVKAGGAYVPLDPVYPRERLAFMIEDAQVTVLLTQAAMAEALPPHAAHVIRLDADWPALENERGENPPPAAQPDHAAYVIYTSGSTGRPKGCVVTHYHVVRLFEATQAWFSFGADDVWTLFHSYAFDFSVWELWGALLHGGRLVIVPFAISRAPEAFLELLRDQRVTVLNQTPSAFRQLMAADEAASRDAAPLALRWIVFGGEALDVAGLRPWFERHGDGQPQLANMYGITETTVHVTWRRVIRADCDHGRSVIGVPIPDLQLHVLDACLQPVPLGVAGEMFIGGAGVARGYLHRPELTAQRFVPDPFSARPGAVLYRSGDLARRLANGDVEYLGRIDEQVKLRGFRIEPGEIEAALTAHPAVRAALVLVRADPPAEPRLAAYVVPRNGAIAVAELREHLRQRVPDYMMPAAIVVLDAFPLTPNGKVDRRALPAPEATRPERTAPASAPSGELETCIARLWCEALGVERVGRDENFFDLGGHSLLIVQVHRRLRAELRREISVVDLFKYSTVRALAEFLEKRAEARPADATLVEAEQRARQQKEARRRRRPGANRA